MVCIFKQQLLINVYELAYTVSSRSLTMWFLTLLLLASISDLQPSTAIANQLPGHLVSKEIINIRLNYFKFIIIVIVPTQRLYKCDWV